MYQISFSEAERALRTANAAVSIAEGHGCLCGVLCALPQFSSQNWLQELLPDPAGELLNHEVVPESLVQLYGETRSALQGDDMDFTLLLPDDATPIGERVAALAQWSQGFLYGFGIGAPHIDPRQYPGEVAEVLTDLSEIARADAAEAGDNDDEERAYAELVEYLRAAVQLVHDELAEQRAAQARQPSLSH